jgi:phosphoribosyl 1,2-cyclic phosphodiesterase
MRELFRRLHLIDVDPESLDALIVTHEHSDHIKGAGPLARRLEIPVYLSGSTLRKALHTIGNLPVPAVIHSGQTIAINDLLIETFTKCHDAADPIGLTVAADGSRLGLITDLGHSTNLVVDRLRGCQALILEFNHDPTMLADGPYPLEVKRRIKGAEGHLSNQEAGELLKSISPSGLRLLIPAHLSETNNLPQKALQEAREALAALGLKDTRIMMSHQDRPTEWTEVPCP